MKKLFSPFFVAVFIFVFAVPSSVFAAVHTWGIHSEISGGGSNSVASDADGSHLVAASNDNNIFISDDAGATWTNRPLPSDSTSASVRVVSDATGQNLVASEQSAGVYTSDDGGVTWTRRQPGGEDIGSRFAAINSDGSVIGVTGGSDFFFYSSDDGGVTWTSYATPDYFSYLSPTTDGTHFVAATFSGSVWTSANGGANWTDRSLAGTFWQLGSNPDGSNLIVSNGTRLYTSINSGANWTERQPAGDINSTWQVGSDADGLNLIVGGGSGGGHVYTSPDGGATWFEEDPASLPVASDADGSHLIAGNFTSPDTVPPSVSSFDPVDDAIEVAVDTIFDIVFDGDIATSTGDITLHLVSDDSLVETIDVAGPKVTLSDTDTLTINPTTALDLGVEYYFLIDAGAIEDIEGNAFAGISDSTTWSFTADTLPIISSLTPTDNATDVALDALSNGNVLAGFNQNVVAGTGNITVKKSSDDSTVVAVDVTDAGVADVSGTTLSLYPNVPLEYATEYYVLIDATAIEDINGNTFAGIADTTTWSFTTRDTPLPPTLDFERVSVDDSGVEGDDYSNTASLSADGRYVAFYSGATNLVPDDTNGSSDIFVYDRDTDTIERVSVSDEGVEGDSESYPSVISPDGRYVAFQSLATNLVPDDTNGSSDIFVYDRDTDTIERVSIDDGGAEGDSSSYGPLDISSDGRYVVFWSEATNLVADDTGGAADIFVYDRDTDTIERVSVDDGGEEGDGQSSDPHISQDGRYVVFTSYATNLVPDDTNNEPDIFVYDRDTDTIERVNVSDEDVEADGSSNTSDISDDGRFIVFDSVATNLTDDAVNGDGAAFLRDRTLGTTELIGIEYVEGNGYVAETTLSADGRYVAYSAYDEGGNNSHIYRYDIEADTELLITENVGDVDGYTTTEGPSVSSDGSVIAFTSENTDLVAGDTNNVNDIFVVEIPADEETPSDEEESSGSGSHRRGGGGSSSGDDTLLESLQTRIQELRAILAALLGSSTTMYTRDLDLNNEGPDVTALQLFLIAQNKGPQAQALAVVGATGFFGPLTQSALAEYQASVGITPAVGFFGPITRAYINGL